MGILATPPKATPPKNKALLTPYSWEGVARIPLNSSLRPRNILRNFVESSPPRGSNSWYGSILWKEKKRSKRSPRNGENPSIFRGYWLVFRDTSFIFQSHQFSGSICYFLFSGVKRVFKQHNSKQL